MVVTKNPECKKKKLPIPLSPQPSLPPLPLPPHQPKYLLSREHQHQPPTYISHAILTYIFHNDTTSTLYTPSLPPLHPSSPDVAGTPSIGTLGGTPLYEQQRKQATILCDFEASPPQQLIQ